MASFEDAKQHSYDWKEFIQFIMDNPEYRKRIGPAWFLLLDILNSADHSGICINTYSKLAKRYNVAVITVKKWRQFLHRQLVIESYSQGSHIAFRLKDPYNSFIRLGTEKKKTVENDELKGLLALKRLLTRADLESDLLDAKAA